MDNPITTVLSITTKLELYTFKYYQNVHIDYRSHYTSLLYHNVSLIYHNINICCYHLFSIGVRKRMISVQNCLVPMEENANQSVTLGGSVFASLDIQALTVKLKQVLHDQYHIIKMVLNKSQCVLVHQYCMCVLVDVYFVGSAVCDAAQ